MIKLKYQSMKLFKIIGCSNKIYYINILKYHYLFYFHNKYSIIKFNY
jgi:hypothetical protein